MVTRQDARADGLRAEALALRHLEKSGLAVIARNFRCKGGEIDLIMRDGVTTVFVEVRYRASGRYGSAAESIDRRKQARILLAAGVYLSRQSRAAATPCRFDAVVLDGALPDARIEWIRGAFHA